MCTATSGSRLHDGGGRVRGCLQSCSSRRGRREELLHQHGSAPWGSPPRAATNRHVGALRDTSPQQGSARHHVPPVPALRHVLLTQKAALQGLRVETQEIVRVQLRVNACSPAHLQHALQVAPVERGVGMLQQTLRTVQARGGRRAELGSKNVLSFDHACSVFPLTQTVVKVIQVSSHGTCSSRSTLCKVSATPRRMRHQSRRGGSGPRAAGADLGENLGDVRVGLGR